MIVLTVFTIRNQLRQMQEEQLVILKDFRDPVVPRKAAAEAILAFLSCLPSLPRSPCLPAHFIAVLLSPSGIPESGFNQPQDASSIVIVLCMDNSGALSLHAQLKQRTITTCCEALNTSWASSQTVSRSGQSVRAILLCHTHCRRWSMSPPKGDIVRL